MKLSKKTYFNKVLGCWIGKNIGGTLGMPFELKRQINNVTFYTQELSGEPLPNDDLDLQLIWLKCLEDRGLMLNARDLGEYWLTFESANCSSYGICKANMAQGWQPPLSGTVGNPTRHSNAAWIRSEIWACICPGRPDLAVQYCYEDGIVDKGNGEGTYAEYFTGAMEAAAFVISDFRKLIEIGLSYIPKDCETYRAVKTAIECYDSGMDWIECRDTILERHRGSCFCGNLAYCSQRDIDKGLHTGKIGYEGPSTIAILVAGMLYGEGDFEKTICITTNMGEDTDCTAGTAGALFGLIYGYDKIPQKWIEPIGHNISTYCYNVTVCYDPMPKTVEELTERTYSLAVQSSLFYDKKNNMRTVDLLSDTDDFSDLDEKLMFAENTPDINKTEVLRQINGPSFNWTLIDAALEYENTYLDPEGEAVVNVLLSAKHIEAHYNVQIEWFSNDLEILPGRVQTVPLWFKTLMPVQKVQFRVKPKEVKDFYEGVIKISVPGRHTRQFIPVSFTGFYQSSDGKVFEG